MAPRKPQNRGDVVSRTPLRLRERTAALRVWMHRHPRTMGGVYFVPVAIVLEHWQTTFPALTGAVAAAAKAVA